MDTIKIFRAGRQVDSYGTVADFSESDLRATAAAYLPGVHEAPLVVGHPAMNKPAFGWVQSLRVVNGVLEASVRQVEPEFAEAVREGRYKKVSSAFYRPNSPRNPHPGVYYLRHVGFLGAQPPAVKGLPDPSFAEEEECIYIVFSEGRVDEKEKQLAEREARLAKMEKDLRRRELAEFAERQVQAGVVLPADKAPMVTFMESIDGGGELEFGEKVATTPLGWFQGWLAKQPSVVPLGVVAGVDKGRGSPTARAVIPAGFSVDANRAGLHQSALTYAEINKVDYVTAVMRLEAGQ